MRKKTELISLRLSKDEALMLSKMATYMGIDKSEMLRFCLKNTYISLRNGIMDAILDANNGKCQQLNDIIDKYRNKSDFK